MGGTNLFCIEVHPKRRHVHYVESGIVHDLRFWVYFCLRDTVLTTHCTSTSTGSRLVVVLQLREG